jgi:hypothetical protein
MSYVVLCGAAGQVCLPRLAAMTAVLGLATVACGRAGVEATAIPKLQLGTVELSFGAKIGDLVAPQAVNIMTQPESSIAWQASTTTAWIAISPQSGITPGVLHVHVVPADLAPGEYVGKVTVKASDPGQVDPQFSASLIIVRMTLAAPGWTAANGPYGGRVLSVATDGTQGGHALAGDARGVVWTSSDGGESFVEAQSLGDQVNWLALAGTSGIAYAAVTSTGVWGSTDFGLTWKPTSFAGNAQQLAVKVDDPSTVYVMNSAQNVLWVSRDGGATWQTSHNGPTNSVATSAADPNEVLVGDYDSVWRSLDNGQTWTHVTGTGNGGMVNIFHDAITGYVLTTDGGARINVSTDNGSSFTTYTGGLPQGAARGITRSGNVFVYASTGGLRQSSDGGMTWTVPLFSTTLPTPEFTSVAGADSTIVTGHAVMSVLLGSGTLHPAKGILAHSVYGISAHPITGDLTVIDEKTNVWKFIRATATWVMAAASPYANPPDANLTNDRPRLSRDPQDVDRILLVQCSGGIKESLDDGMTWHSSSSSGGACTRELSWAPDDPNTVYAASDNVILVSHDRGLTFSQYYSVPSSWPVDVAALPGGQLAYEGYTGGAHRLDAARNDTDIGACYVTHFLNATPGGDIWAGSLSCVYWIAAGSSTPQVSLANSYFYVGGIVVDGTDVWVGYMGGGLFHSADYGTTWQDGHSPSPNVTSLALDPIDGRVWVGTGDLGLWSVSP